MVWWATKTVWKKFNSNLSTRKDKNDINKIIFKSGDMQMSPYADFPKNNRISMEWGRETIEMQENGSTKNLLQMTDIYYSVRRLIIHLLYTTDKYRGNWQLKYCVLNVLSLSLSLFLQPALRNSDLDRNGLYPFTGLPGSRHSCIYPAQWNPSFISDDSRRRDYFWLPHLEHTSTQTHTHTVILTTVMFHDGFLSQWQC